MYIYIYIYIYTHLYTLFFRQGNRHDICLMVCVVDIFQLLFNGFRRWFSFYGFRRGREHFLMVSVVVFLMVSVVAGKHFFYYGFCPCSSKRGLRRAGGGMPQTRRKFATALGTRTQPSGKGS